MIPKPSIIKENPVLYGTIRRYTKQYCQKFDTNIATLAELNDELNDENLDRLQSGLKITVPAALVATISENRKFDFFKTTLGQ